VGLEVGSGGERIATTGQDRDPQPVVVTEVAPDLTQQLVRLDVDRVLDLGPVERDVRNRPRFSYRTLSAMVVPSSGPARQ